MTSNLSSWGRCSNAKVGSFGTDTEAVLVRQGMGGGVLIRTELYYSLPHPSMHRLTSRHRFAGIAVDDSYRGQVSCLVKGDVLTVAHIRAPRLETCWFGRDKKEASDNRVQKSMTSEEVDDSDVVADDLLMNVSFKGPVRMKKGRSCFGDGANARFLRVTNDQPHK